MKKMIIIIALAGAGCIEETTRDVADKPIETVEIEQVVDTIVQDTVQVKTIWEQFVDAVIFVESIDNDSAYNHREKAVGCLQIRPIMVREVNRVLKKSKINLLGQVNLSQYARQRHQNSIKLHPHRNRWI